MKGGKAVSLFAALLPQLQTQKPQWRVPCLLQCVQSQQPLKRVCMCSFLSSDTVCVLFLPQTSCVCAPFFVRYCVSAPSLADIARVCFFSLRYCVCAPSPSDTVCLCALSPSDIVCVLLLSSDMVCVFPSRPLCALLLPQIPCVCAFSLRYCTCSLLPHCVCMCSSSLRHVCAPFSSPSQLSLITCSA